MCTHIQTNPLFDQMLGSIHTHSHMNTQTLKQKILDIKVFKTSEQTR